MSHVKIKISPKIAGSVQILFRFLDYSIILLLSSYCEIHDLMSPIIQ